jgi:hypothetical protein
MTIYECREEYKKLIEALESTDLSAELYEENLEVTTQKLVELLNKFSKPRSMTWRRITKDLPIEEQIAEVLVTIGRDHLSKSWFDILSPGKNSNQSEVTGDEKDVIRTRDFGLKIELPKYSGDTGKYAKFSNQFEATLKLSKIEKTDWVMYLGQCMKSRAYDIFLEICANESRM